MRGRCFNTSGNFRSFLAKTICSVGCITQLAGCSQDAQLIEANRKLAAANEKIVALESQLNALQPASKVASAMASTPRQSEVERIKSEAPAALTGQQWRYDADEEKMSGGTRRTASVESSNSVQFDFPYNGSQNGHLTLRIDPQYGKDVIFRIEKGQILCSSYDGCSVQVRFDDEKPVAFPATGAADHSTTVVFLQDYNRFLTKMRKAKRVRMSVNVYQQGSPVFEFDVQGFDLNKYTSKS